MPGYTHLQIAMPSSFGLWFGAYAESLTDDMLFLQAAYKMTNRNPLGSAAGYGSSFPLNRTMTTQLLHFRVRQSFQRRLTLRQIFFRDSLRELSCLLNDFFLRRQKTLQN